MGASKAWLDFGGQPLLRHVVESVGPVAEVMVVSAAQGQELPALPPDVLVVRDSVASAGPLQGLADALTAVADRCDAVFVCGCDAPFVTPAYIERLAELLNEHDAAVPVLAGCLQPLSAVYRVGVAKAVAEQLARGQRSMMGLLEAIDVRPVQPEEWTDVDPWLEATRSFNTPGEYRLALENWRRRHKST